jgi:hypothetical protein
MIAPTTSSRAAFLSADSGDHAHGADHRDDHQHHVECEHRLPRPEFEHRARRQQAENRTCSGYPGPDADRLGPALRRERRGDGGQRGRHHERRADSEKGSQRNERVGVRDQHGGQRGSAEYAEAGNQGPPPAVAIAERTGWQQQRREDESVGVDDP